MTLTRAKIYCYVTLSAIALGGCEPTKPPLTSLDQADRAIALARASGAPTYAPLELRYADEGMANARAAVEKHDYAAALARADEALANADLALAKARLGKAREQVDARSKENAALRQDLGSGESSRETPQP